MPKLVEADAFNWAAQKPSTAPTPSFAQPAEEEPVRVQQKTAEDVVVPAAESVAEMPSMERSSLDSSRNAVGAHQAPTVSEQKTSAEMAPLQASVTAHRTGGGRGSKGRVKTRLLGFSGPQSTVHDPMTQSREAAPAVQAQFPVGWLVVVDGPGRGASFALFDGLTQIGRGEGQTVRLDFGDNTISRENHAAIAFDGEQRRFFFGHGGKANLVRLNGRPVLSTEDLATNSVIRIGETTLRFVALCGEEFSWVGQDMEVPGHAQFG
ncbi:FHA domain-containing protein [Shimia sp. R9_3]|nr:FHA domain-containing protein [Shimia sp. R9_3]